MLNVSDEILIRTDGGSNPNPGNAGCAFTVEQEGKLLCAHCEYVGIKTNNQAEYMALIMAIEYVKSNSMLKKKDILVLSDSQLLVNQMNGEYKVKSEEIKILWSKVMKLIAGMSVTFKWISRDENHVSDFLVRFVRGEKHLE
jgi:ribonuclease HI|uniref:Ribonuclease HI family protein n=1 Tax=Mesoaciditoga lauensis TaxID=1495039 RepID=A0A7V3RF53_9BACT